MLSKISRKFKKKVNKSRCGTLKIHINCVVRKLAKCVRKTRILQNLKIQVIIMIMNHNCSSVNFECQLGLELENYRNLTNL